MRRLHHFMPFRVVIMAEVRLVQAELEHMVWYVGIVAWEERRFSYSKKNR
jgi:hypothetical protein